MPVRSDPQTATDKWVTNLSGSTQAMQRGVAAVTVAPGAKAAAAADKWLMKVTAARDKFARRVGAVTLTDWQNAMTSYGINRVSQGAQAKKAKFTSFMTDYLPYLQQGVNRVDQMPKVTLSDGIARAVAMIEHNAAYQRKGS
jgi:hypothetical protein